MENSIAASLAKFFLERDNDITPEKLHIFVFLALGKGLEEGLIDYDSLPEDDIPMAVPDDYIEKLRKDVIEKRMEF